MRIRRPLFYIAVLMLVSVLNAQDQRFESRDSQAGTHCDAAALPYTTRCDISLPIRIEMEPLNQPEVGQTARFRVDVESSLDPDLVSTSWVEYEFPGRMRRIGETAGARTYLGTARSGRTRLEVVVPDTQRYEVRARYVVRLTNGRTIGRTAVRLVNIGDMPPDGMVGSMVDPAGNSVRVYRGVPGRN